MTKTVILGITGGIAAYRSLEIIKLLKQNNIDVFAILTHSGQKMVSIKELNKVSQNKVYFDLFEENFSYKKVLKNRVVEHIQLADKADLIVIGPATANIIGKIAHGIADDFLTTTILAATCPILIFPSMNVHMWENPVVCDNIKILKQRGYYIFEPDSGPLACGYEGKGRLKEPQEIVKKILTHLDKKDKLKGQKIIITSGGTSEKVDEVRIITNRSSGKMGAALAEVCHIYGADVLLLRAKNAVKPQISIKEEVFTTADDLSNLLKKHVKDANIIFHAAAISDFGITPFKGKISSNKSITLTLKPRRKIINMIKEINPGIYLVAFKAEYKLSKKKLIKKSLEKLQESNANVVIANDIGKSKSGFESDSNEVSVVFANGKSYKILHALKREVAKNILDLLLQSKSFN